MSAIPAFYVDTSAGTRLSTSRPGRYRFSDFAPPKQIAARYASPLSRAGAASTGFRAPALQQQFFTATAINFIVIGGVSTPTEVSTLPATDPISASLGARPLEPEESINTSLGAVFRVRGFELTVDAYRIEIENRIVLSENLLGSPTGNARRGRSSTLNPGPRKRWEAALLHQRRRYRTRARRGRPLPLPHRAARFTRPPTGTRPT